MKVVTMRPYLHLEEHACSSSRYDPWLHTRCEDTLVVVLSLTPMLGGNVRSFLPVRMKRCSVLSQHRVLGVHNQEVVHEYPRVRLSLLLVQNLW